jgi:hypothetical protein
LIVTLVVLIFVTWVIFISRTYRGEARYHGRNGSRGPSGTHPIDPDAIAAPRATPAPTPMNVTNAGA